jgi:hypothetical protein
MSDILSTISNFLSASWRAGAALFLLGMSVYLSKRYDVPPLSELDGEWYKGSILVGALGLGFVIVHGLILLAQGIGFIAPQTARLVMAPIVRKREQKLSVERAARERALAVEKATRDRELALKNWDTASPHDLTCLLWIKEKSQKRFKASRYNSDLNKLYESHLLEQDISEREEISYDIHWIVPDVIWEKLQKINIKKLNIRLGTRPPWDRSPYG